MTIKVCTRVAALAVVAVALLGGCYPKGAEYVEELDLVYTNYDAQANFQAKHTYAIPDSVVKITGDVFNDPSGNNKVQFVGTTYATTMLAEINKNMAAYGYTKVDKFANPDVIVLVSSMVT